MRITADTNVMLSSTFWAGASDKIMRLVESKEIELVLSEEIVNEFINVLEYEEVKRKAKGLSVRRTVEKILSNAEIIVPQEKLSIVKQDPDDDKVIECAVEGKSNFIITQDKHLLKMKSYKQIRIITPQEFLREF